MNPRPSSFIRYEELRLKHKTIISFFLPSGFGTRTRLAASEWSAEPQRFCLKSVAIATVNQ